MKGERELQGKRREDGFPSINKSSMRSVGLGLVSQVEDEGGERDAEEVREDKTERGETAGGGKQKAGGNLNVCFVLQVEKETQERASSAFLT